MKIPNISINIVFVIVGAVFSSFLAQSSFSQGFNNNEWIFGYCEGTDNNYISFGKDGIAKVNTLPAANTFGKGNAAMAVDPVTGQVLFYTDGALVYNYLNLAMQGVVGELGGSETGRQTVAISELDYSEGGGNKLFYVFFLNTTGELEYAVADMNNQGGAQANQPPAGAISPGGTLGPASGSILVVKSAGSPNFLISFENGSLVSREIGETEGDFTQQGNLPIDFSPKAMVFDEESGMLVIIPDEPNTDLLRIPFDTSTGTFGSTERLSQTGASEPVEGLGFSPDGAFVYFSQGDQLLRLPMDDPTAAAEEVPLAADIFGIYDVKTGPDGQVYYIYEEAEGGPQFVGRVTNPDEEELESLILEEDPFNGTDFCGRIFPVFAPNIDLENTVDFTWAPQDPCMNNPLQLTSQITPANYQPVSFEWTINPPPTDEDGEEIELDLDEEHLLLPAGATSEQNISVSLMVTFADGETREVSHNITFQESNLQVQFTASDTTLCHPACIDLMEILEVQSGDQQGGGQGGGIPGGIGGLPGGGGQQGGQGGNYEYFWSNKKEEGWGPEAPNEVCLPGFYWVLVREQGSSCYAYASTRVKIWDVDDQSNNIWYFGNGAGLDFNRDPDNPDAPTPRPIENPHPQNIPAGVTTISDQAGEVLFYTDGQTVWDLNGNPMQNGNNIGGDNLSSQSVLAVPLPQEETLFYLFTTQTSAGGSNEVNFSLVDIKGDNPSGVGNVVSSSNFLFSPSTQHSAALGAGDTTWVAFHELGNNTFRFYPVSNEGVGQPVFSSVGGNHDFGTGVGTMKFSPDGSQLAVTINENGQNRVEIFDFDQNTGQLTEYAVVDLGSEGQIYGLEFSEDGKRVYVSYRNGGPGVEEFFIGGVETTDSTDPENPVTSTCPSCFEDANSEDEIEACILESRTSVPDTGGLPLGALQIGPDGQIYVAVVGSNLIGQIQVGENCNPSSFNQNAVEAMPGTSNLGLPSFVQNSGSNIPDPSLAGPGRLCLDPESGAVGTYEGGGEPDIDTYFWTVTNAQDSVVHSWGGTGEEGQNLEYSFPSAGVYQVNLEVDRCGTPWEESFRLEVEVYDTPQITLPSDLPLCNDSPLELTAVDPEDPDFDDYIFIWTNAAGDTLGNENTLTVTEESIYTVTVVFALPAGEDPETFQACPATQSVFVGPAFEFEIDQSAEEVCWGETALFTPDTPVSGEWFAIMEGSTDRIALGEFFELELATDVLPDPGNFEIIFRTRDPIDSTCTVEKTMDLRVNPLPAWRINRIIRAESCEIDNGSINLTARTNIDSLVLEETGQVFSLVQNENLLITGLAAGTYTLSASNNGCRFSSFPVVDNENPPRHLEYTVHGISTTCGPDGVESGAIRIRFSNGLGSGSYVLTNVKENLKISGTFSMQSVVSVPVPPGQYKVEVLDENGCTNPNTTIFIIDPVTAAEFSIPAQAVSCGSFTFTPLSDQNLVFTLIDEAGNRARPATDGSFTITRQGIYTVLGEGADPEENICPTEKTIEAMVAGPVDFELNEPSLICEGPFVYEIDLLGQNPDLVNITWFDSDGQRVSNGLIFSADISGEYSVEVLPAGVVECEGSQVHFQVPEVPAPISLALNHSSFCAEDPFSSLTLEADLTAVAQIFWYAVTNGTPTLIPNTNDAESISVSSEGTYRVLLFNEAGCEIGRDEVEIIRSITEPPVLDPSYTICSLENVHVILDPGSYDSYEWVLDNEIVSNAATFTPTFPGNYELRVEDELGCSFILEFAIVEDCELRITFPNAIIPGIENKNFEVYANEFIDDIEVLIYNRWGELIFYCAHENIEPSTAFCQWDGTVNGGKVPNGSYPVLIRYKSENQGIEKVIKKAIVVLE